MTTSPYTPEPWRRRGSILIAGEPGEEFAVMLPDPEFGPDNAGRVVACVNACAGIPSDALPAAFAVVAAAVRLYDCQCEFGDDPFCCSEHAGDLDTAVLRFKALREGEASPAPSPTPTADRLHTHASEGSRVGLLKREKVGGVNG